MDNIFGRSQTRTTSGLIHNKTLRTALEVIFLLAVGFFAILLHARFRSPIQVPGHHGIEFMALLLLGRISSRMKFASSISSFGIGFLLLFPVFGFNDPLMGFNYMLPGFLLDFACNFSGNLSRKTWFLASIAGLAYMLIPVSRLIITAFTGYQYGAFLKYGLIVPVISHLVFGMTGGLLGTGASKILSKITSKLGF